jgi:hypothetical protein
VKWNNGKASKGAIPIFPIGDWRVGDVLKDKDNVDILEIVKVINYKDSKAYRFNLLDIEGSGIYCNELSKNLEPCFRPKPEAKPDIRKMVIDGLNEILKKIEEVR